jgi:predicted MFS family arabinose efflux permease
VGFAGFVVLGLFTSVLPAALGSLMQEHNRAVIGATVFAIFFASIIGQLCVPRLGARALPVGCVLIVIGMGVFAFSLGQRELAALVVAALIAGAGQGISFRAGLVMVTGATPEDQRAAVTSAFFDVLYVGISIPVIAVGWAAQSEGLQHTGMVTAAIVAALAIATLATTRRRSDLQPSAG